MILLIAAAALAATAAAGAPAAPANAPAAAPSAGPCADGMTPGAYVCRALEASKAGQPEVHDEKVAIPDLEFEPPRPGPRADR